MKNSASWLFHCILCLSLGGFGSSILGSMFAPMALADENLLGYVKGAETLPEGSWEAYQIFTSRRDKGAGYYSALDSKTIVEYGLTHRLTTEGSMKMLSVDTNGIRIDGYLPEDEKYGLKPSGVEGALKYNFLSPAKDDFGLSAYFSLNYDWLDSHSGQKKDKFSAELLFLFQKYFYEGELIWVGNLGMESTHADRAPINNLPADFDWPTEPEMEIEFLAGTGLSYRFMPKWFIGAEALFEEEFETEVNRERWSIFAGPSLHYGSEGWWSTLTWFPQWSGGGEGFPEQDNKNLHLVEKTKHELRVKVGYDF